MNPDLSIYLVTDSAQLAASGHDFVTAVMQAVEGGVTAVQLREKQTDGRDFLALVEAISNALPDQVSLFINDRIDVFQVARLQGIRVTGVHLGQADLPVTRVRELLGPDAVIGLTANTAEELAAAVASPARIDYVGIGTVRATVSKDDAPAPLGVAGVAALARGCSLPAVAIGGIVPDDLAALRAGGLAGAAVVSWICTADDPLAAAEELTRAWQGTL